MATRSIFLEELQDKIVNLPTDGFVLMGETMSKKEWEEIIKVIMAKNNVPDEDEDRLINILNLMEEEDETFRGLCSYRERAKRNVR